MAHADVAAADERRCRGERGTAIITISVLLFVVTAGAIIVLARDVNRSVSNRSVAQSVAFQAARAGAQQIDVGDLRGDDASDVSLEPEAAVEAAALAVAEQLFAAYEVEGVVDATAVDGVTVTVTVTINDPAGDQTATGSAEPQTGP